MPEILVVDDDTAIRTLLARSLKDLGTIEQAASGDDALKMLAKKPYDAVLLDLHMPGTDGFGVLEQVAKKSGPNAKTPFVIITADPGEQSHARAFHAGAVFFVQKPLRMALLAMMVKGILTKK
ncbi:MAG: response regulator [Polyangiales bacterium]